MYPHTTPQVNKDGVLNLNEFAWAFPLPSDLDNLEKNAQVRSKYAAYF